MAMILGCFRPRTDDGRDTSSHNDGSHTSSTASGTRIVTYVELLRRTSEPLGLVLDGGTDRDMPVFVAELYPGGVADNSGTLQRGDLVLAINGVSTDPLTHQEITSLLQNAGNYINLEIAYDMPPGGANPDENTVKKMANVTFKKEGNAFGFTISGGKTEGRPITVSHVLVGTAAYRRGTLKAGDRIMKIQGTDVRRASKKEALSLLQTCGEDCTLEIEYDVTLHSGLEEGNRLLQVEILKPKSASLGISLSESRSPCAMILISHIQDAGIADRCGALHVGDQLLSINKISLENKAVNEAIQLLIHSDFHVKLEILPWRAIPHTPELANDEAISDSMSRGERLAGSQASHSQLSLTSSTHTHSHLLPYYPDTMEVILHADSIGNHRGGGPAARLGQLKVGDRVLAINRIRMNGVTLEQAVKIVHEAGDTISMEVEFNITDTVVPTADPFEVTMVKTNTLNLGITINGSHHRGDLVWISNIKKGGIACREGILQPGDVILAINQQSLENSHLEEAAHMLKSCGDLVTLLVTKDTSGAAVMQHEPVIYSVELRRNGQGLGITLTGSRSEPNHPIIIGNIKEGGVAYSTGTMRAGDLILAINGESLHMKTVPEAIQMLQRSGDVVTLKICKSIKKTRGARSRPKTASPTGKHHHSHGRTSRGVSVLRSSSSSRPYSSSGSNHEHRTSGKGYLGYGNGTTPSLGHRLPATPSTMGLGTPLSTSPEGRLMEGMSWGSSHNGLGTVHNGVGPSSMEMTMNDPRLEGVVSYHGTSNSNSPSLRPSRTPEGANFVATATDSCDEKAVGLQVQQVGERGCVFKEFREAPVTGKENLVFQSIGPQRGTQAPQIPTRCSGRGGMVGGASLLLEPFRNGGSGGPMLDPDPDNAAKAGSDVASEEDESKKAILESARFQQQLKAIADSGSSDPDSDVEPPGSAFGVHVDPRYGGQRLDPYGGGPQAMMVMAMTAGGAHPYLYRGALVPQRPPGGLGPHVYHQEEGVVLQRHSGEKDFGFSVANAEGGGVYVKGLRPGGPAQLSRRLQPLDRIVQINGVDVMNSDCDTLLPLLRDSGNSVELIVIRSYLYSNERKHL
ncbi:hypothetical protein EMCRGX_G002037 [Ephydatia muelleri]